jgi:hypothetical protein
MQDATLISVVVHRALLHQAVVPDRQRALLPAQARVKLFVLQRGGRGAQREREALEVSGQLARVGELVEPDSR